MDTCALHPPLLATSNITAGPLSIHHHQVGQASVRLSLLLRRLESSRADRACVRLAFLCWHTKTSPLRPASHGVTASRPQLQPDPSRLAEDEEESASDVEDGDSVVGGSMATPPDGDVPMEGDGGSEAVLAGRLLLYARTFAEVSILIQQPLVVRATQGISLAAHTPLPYQPMLNQLPPSCWDD